MNVTTSLYIMPTEDLDESDNLDGDELLTHGWETPPPPGAGSIPAGGASKTRI